MSLDLSLTPEFIADVYKVTGCKFTDEPCEIITVQGDTHVIGFDDLGLYLTSRLESTTASFGKDAKKITIPEVIENIQEKLNADAPLPNGTVDAIVRIINAFNMPVFDLSKVNNREFLTHYYAQSKEDVPAKLVYLVLFFLMTNRTLYVKRFREFNRSCLISEREKEIISYLRTNKTALAQEFRRNRALLLFLKKKLPAAKHLINQISRLSRKLNRPAVQPKSLRNQKWNKQLLSAKATDELCRMLYASNTITVRNGRRFVNEKMAKSPYPTDLILDILKNRDDVFTQEQKDLKERGWSIAVPVSAKQGAGNIPNGSHFTVPLPKDKKNIRIGVRWFVNADLDFSATVLQPNGNWRFGWDAQRRGLLAYSGDMQVTVHNPISDREEASEWFTLSPDALDETIIFDLSSYRISGESNIVELFINDEVVPIEQPISSSVLGYLKDGEFYIWVQPFGHNVINVTSPEDFTEESIDFPHYFL